MPHIALPGIPLLGGLNMGGESNRKSHWKISISRRTAYALAPLAWLVAIPLAHGGIPWALSLLTHRYGWVNYRPGIVNLIGLLPIFIGCVGLLWVFIQGVRNFADAPERIELDWKPKLLLVRGPYAYSRNPMYVSEFALWFGWAIFFGSITVLIGSIVICVVVKFIVKREEHDLKSQFDPGYSEYMAKVPRWAGKVRQ
ncbi:MAG: methyltransferase family protein [Blastocatellia bacterium]